MKFLQYCEQKGTNKMALFECFCGNIVKRIYYSGMSWVKVDAIRDLREKNGLSIAELCELFDVSRSVVSSVINYKTWKSIT